jgi:hypothetical protein
VRAAVEDGSAIGADEVREAGRLAAIAILVAQAAVEGRSEPFAPTRVLEDPGLREERRSVAHVLPMAAVELGDPIAVGVEVEARDRPLHGLSSTRR